MHDDDSTTLPVHPATGLVALGFRRDGRPIWPILGAAEAADDDADEGADEGDDEDQDDDADDDAAEGAEGKDGEGAKPLGDQGQKAIDRMKQRERTARAQVRDLKKQLADALASKDGEGEKTPDQIRAEIRAEVEAAALTERIADKVEARARAFADPEVAVALLQTNFEDFAPDGQIDVEEIDAALADLLQKKPYLAAAQSRRFQGDADGGQRNAARKSQLTKEDLDRMSPEEILKAAKDGRTSALAGKK